MFALRTQAKQRALILREFMKSTDILKNRQKVKNVIIRFYLAFIRSLKIQFKCKKMDSEIVIIKIFIFKTINKIQYKGYIKKGPNFIKIY